MTVEEQIAEEQNRLSRLRKSLTDARSGNESLAKLEAKRKQLESQLLRVEGDIEAAEIGDPNLQLLDARIKSSEAILDAFAPE